MPTPTRKTSSTPTTSTSGSAGTIEDVLRQADLFLANLGEPSCLLDHQCVIRYQNLASRALWGVSIGKSCQEACQLRASHCEACPALLTFSDGQQRTTERILRSTQGERYMEVTTTPITKPDGAIIAVLQIHHDITDSKMQEKGRERLIQELQSALSTVKRLSGLLPICSCCKKIRNSNGNWVPLESYLRSHAEVEFSQCLCEECSGTPQTHTIPGK